MPKINPQHSWQALDDRYRAETEPRVRTLLKAVRDHMEFEIGGDLQRLMETLTAEPVYHFWGTAAPMVLSGREAVAAFYRQMIEAGGNQFEVVIDTIVADSANVVTEGQVKQVHTGKELLAMGRTDVLGARIANGDLFLTTTQLITVWPGAADGRLVGEDIYFGHDPFAHIARINAADLPHGYRWEHRI
jgi:SnoaL-like domain